MYGAVGDGVHDDTTAFENALAENSYVFVPNGSYRIKRPIDLTDKKSLVGSDNQGATLIYDGADTDSIVLIGSLSILRNINITVRKEAFKGVVLDTDNMKIASSTFGLNSRVEHIIVKFNIRSSEARLIRIIIDSGTDANNMPSLTGACFQTYNDICVDSSSHPYGCGIEMLLLEKRVFTEEAKQGFPWLTHIDFDDVYLGTPYTAIKAGVVNTSGGEHFNRIHIGHILFNNVYSQNYGIEKTRYFFDVDNFAGFFSKCIGWDYHHTTQDYNEKVNIIGENANLSFSDCEMNFGAELLKCCDFTAEKNSGFTVEDSPEYFMNKYFSGSFLKSGYDSVDAKIDTKLSDANIANIAEDRVNEILYSGYTNVLDDPLTQYKVGVRFSDSSQAWVEYRYSMAIIIPIVKGGNAIRWNPDTYVLSDSYQSMFFFNDDELTAGTFYEQWSNVWVSDDNGGYLRVDNPSGYKYVSIPFNKADISSETMTMTINREIGGSADISYVDYVKRNVVLPTVEEAVGKMTIPTKTSQLENDSGFLTQHQSLSGYAKAENHYTKTESDGRYQPKGNYLTSVPSEYVTEKELNAKGYLTEHQDISGKANKSDAETWTFTLADGSTVTKKVVLAE
jgi:hypothetical protein